MNERKARHDYGTNADEIVQLTYRLPRDVRKRFNTIIPWGMRNRVLERFTIDLMDALSVPENKQLVHEYLMGGLDIKIAFVRDEV